MVVLRTPRPFPLGKTVATPAALAVIEQAAQSPLDFLQRHARCDWGEVDSGDRELNDLALDDGTRLLSAYRTAKDARLWIITEADRSATTILLPEEY